MQEGKIFSQLNAIQITESKELKTGNNYAG